MYSLVNFFPGRFFSELGQLRSTLFGGLSISSSLNFLRLGFKLFSCNELFPMTFSLVGKFCHCRKSFIQITCYIKSFVKFSPVDHFFLRSKTFSNILNRRILRSEPEKKNTDDAIVKVRMKSKFCLYFTRSNETLEFAK